MTTNTKIEWADLTWSPLVGCDRVSPGCDGCYAIRTAHRLAANPNPKIGPLYAGTTHRTEDGRLDWTGQVNLLRSRLDDPLRWRKPHRVFVNSQSDLFHKDVPDGFIGSVFEVMARTPQHTYIILTKRPARMRSLLTKWGEEGARQEPYTLPDGRTVNWAGPGTAVFRRDDMCWVGPVTWPLPNVILGVSVEDQHWADIRIPQLLATPAAVRCISAEPLLGPIDLSPWLYGKTWSDTTLGGGGVGGQAMTADPSPISWVIVGGESGPGARPMHPWWARVIRDQCQDAGVTFTMKQWGEWGPAPWRVDREEGEDVDAYKARAEATCATHAYALWAHAHDHFVHEAGHRPWSIERTSLDERTHAPIRRWGKKAAGRELDGQVHDAFPEVPR